MGKTRRKLLEPEQIGEKVRLKIMGEYPGAADQQGFLRARNICPLADKSEHAKDPKIFLERCYELGYKDLDPPQCEKYQDCQRQQSKKN